MKKVRIIARLDIKGSNVIKGVHLECLRVVGKPGELAEKYYFQGADELIYIDTVASLYRRNNLLDIVNQASDKIFIPFTVGGGVRTIDDIREFLKAGADKVAINTAATKDPTLITKASKIFGSQCIVSSVEAKKVGEGKWEAYTDNGRERTGLDVIEWVRTVERLGAGEILLTSIDREGTQQGFDTELIEKVSNNISVPLIISGGAGSIKDISDCINENDIDAIALASVLHYNKMTIAEIKEEARRMGIEVRGSHISDSGKKDIDSFDEKIKDRHTEEKISEVSIIDYGINNLKSISKAFEKIGRSVKIIDTMDEILSAKCLILPGVGAFENGMIGLQQKGLIEPLRQKVKDGTPLLGICLGMQLLFSESEEFGLNKGLNFIPGRVIPFKPVAEVRIKKYSVPHIGWNELRVAPQIDDKSGWEGTPLENTKANSDVYFAHSYHSIPEDPKETIAVTEYGEQEFCAVVKKDNIIGTQFHPEKSGWVGLNMLKTFCEQNESIPIRK